LDSKSRSSSISVILAMFSLLIGDSSYITRSQDNYQSTYCDDHFMRTR
jgi:hypothetical protein